jgi:hypothetical protein
VLGRRDEVFVHHCQRLDILRREELLPGFGLGIDHGNRILDRGEVVGRLLSRFVEADPGGALLGDHPGDCLGDAVATFDVNEAREVEQREERGVVCNLFKLRPVGLHPKPAAG